MIYDMALAWPVVLEIVSDLHNLSLDTADAEIPL